MDQLDQEQVQAIKKLGTSRLISKLLSVGYTEEALNAMSRDAMLQACAVCAATGKDIPESASPAVTGYDVELEREKFDYERRKFDAMYRLKKEKQDFERAQKQSVVSLAKQYGDAIKASVKPMGAEMMDVVLFFRHIEAIFRRFDVPENLQAALIQPYLNEKSRSVVSRMDPSLCNDYKSVREVILKEHKLSPCAYLELFNKLTRASDETAVMYRARLKSLLSMYVESRKVDNFDDLMSLIVCDRIKSTLSENCLRHVLSVEAGTDKGWLQMQQLAECVDLYRANRFGDRPRASAIGSSSSAQQAGIGSKPTGIGTRGAPPRPVQSRQVGVSTGQPVASGTSTSRVTCYKCKEVGHTRKFCPLNNQQAERRVNRCSTVCLDIASDCQTVATMSPIQRDTRCDDVNASDIVDSLNDECLNATDEVNVCLSNDNDSSVMYDDVKSYICDYGSYRDFVSLQYVNVSIDELNAGNRSDNVACIKAIEDSGSELCVVKASLVESVSLPKVGTVRLRGIVGAPVSADLVKLHISLVNDSASCNTSVPVICAVCPELNEDLILTPVLVKQLQSVTGDSTVCTVQRENVCDSVTCSNSDASANVFNLDTTDNDSVGLADEQTTDTLDGICADDFQSKATVKSFLREQQNDETLQSCWEKAKLGKGGFVIRDELLYHIDRIDCVGEKCVQLCLPKSRHKDVLELAHCTLGCHQACRRTRDRIRLSFYWPSLSQDVRNFCDRCEVCQKASRITVWDRTPITAIPHAQYAFQEFYRASICEGGLGSRNSVRPSVCHTRAL